MWSGICRRWQVLSSMIDPRASLPSTRMCSSSNTPWTPRSTAAKWMLSRSWGDHTPSTSQECGTAICSVSSGECGRSANTAMGPALSLGTVRGDTTASGRTGKNRDKPTCRPFQSSTLAPVHSDRICRKRKQLHVAELLNQLVDLVPRPHLLIGSSESFS